MTAAPRDWPTEGPIDLRVHDLPHASSTTEWWYVNSHLQTASGRQIGVFASFFRIATGRDAATDELQYAHSLSWALADSDGGASHAESLVDRAAPELGRRRLAQGEGTGDPRLRRALLEVLEKDRVPYPDQLFVREPVVGIDHLELDFDGRRFHKRDDGTYQLELTNPHARVGCDLVFAPRKGPVRHGDDGVVRSVHGEDMFYYFLPRCDVTGTITIDGEVEPLAAASTGWYDHEFGRHHQADEAPASAKGSPEANPAGAAEPGASPAARTAEIAWNWVAVQLDDGSEVTGCELIDTNSGETVGRWAVEIDADGAARSHGELSLTWSGTWTSTRTFNDYPAQWHLSVPAAGLEIDLEPDFPDQEIVTLISKPAFWEGRCRAVGTRNGEAVQGRAWVERSGFLTVDDLDSFFKSVGRQVRASVQALIPFEPSFEQVRDLVASPTRADLLDGVDTDQFVDTLIRPVREIVDRGGKSWRSYAALACCDVVGGDSRRYVRWLAMPELMHVGSLIVDDVQDGSTWRRGGPTSHVVYGEPLAINAGTACYFMGQKLLVDDSISRTDQIRLYDLYFQALRAGHAGQAIDIDGVDRFVDAAVASGESEPLQRRVLAIHRLKTASPAGALARMGALVGGGTEAQIEGVGAFFESVGLAFQIVDDVLNLRGFKGNLKDRGEDIAHGKVTLPVAKAFGLVDAADRAWLWQTVKAKPQDRETIEAVIARLEACGAVDECATEARHMVEAAWAALDPLVEDSLPKMMLRAFGWYVLDRHY